MHCLRFLHNGCTCSGFFARASLLHYSLPLLSIAHDALQAVDSLMPTTVKASNSQGKGRARKDCSQCPQIWDGMSRGWVSDIHIGECSDALHLSLQTICVALWWSGTHHVVMKRNTCATFFCLSRGTRWQQSSNKHLWMRISNPQSGPSLEQSLPFLRRIGWWLSFILWLGLFFFIFRT